MSLSPPSALAAACTSKRIRFAAALLLLLIYFLTLSDVSKLRSTADGLVPSTPDYDELPETAEGGGPTDWSRFAYGQYVTDSLYLCNSVMFFAMLHQLDSKAERLIMYPRGMLPDPDVINADTHDGRLLIKARDEYGVKLAPITVSHKSKHDQTWADSFTKLLVFNQTQYDRVLCIDSDSTMMQHMDELFLLPPATVAMPRAYWLYPKKKVLTSAIILVQPSHEEFNRVQKTVKSAGPEDYDMEIINQLYGDSALIIPHRSYILLTGEFTHKEHRNYLGNEDEVWDPVAAYNEAKFLHFSDFPVPKPWLEISDGVREQNQPSCKILQDDTSDCTSRDLWNGFYTDFKERRKVCKLGNTIGEQAPDLPDSRV